MLELTVEQISMGQGAVDKSAALQLLAQQLVADGLVAEGVFLRSVDVAVDGEDDVGAVGDHEVFRGDGYALRTKAFDFFDEAGGVEYDAVADDAELARPQDARGDEMEDVFLAVGDDGVPGIVAALAACDHIGGFGKEVDDFAFAFVAPLGADNNGIHDKNGTRRP